MHVRSTLFLLALSAGGLVLIGFSFSLPSEPVTTCLTNSYGTFCAVHYLVGDRVISCGLRPGGPPVSCIQSVQWWINPIPFLYFKSIQARIVGIVLFLTGIVGYAILVVTSFDAQLDGKSQDFSPVRNSSTPPIAPNPRKTHATNRVSIIESGSEIDNREHDPKSLLNRLLIPSSEKQFLKPVLETVTEITQLKQ